jgi:hypothetical protein
MRPRMQGFDKYGIGHYDALPTPALQQALGLKCGVVSSGNSLDYTAEDMELMTEHEASVKVGVAGRRVCVVWCMQRGARTLPAL